MDSLPRDVYPVAAVRAAEQTAAGALGVPMATLMERAGLAALAEIAVNLRTAKRLLVLCGPGNNGGDGYVLAHHAALQGYSVTVCAPGGPPVAPSDGHGAYVRWVANGAIVPFAPALVATADVVVDALFGSGLARALGPPYDAIVDCVNRIGATILAIDVPSGLNADSGEAAGVAVHATRTLALCGLKPGYYLGHGPDYTGTLGYAGLGVPAASFTGPALLARIGEEERTAIAPRRARLAHKGSNGHVLIVAGGPGMAGAARLCGLAALRVGAGLVTVATHPSCVPIVAAGSPELICVAVDHAAALAPLVARADVVAVGPGLGQSPWAGELTATVLAALRPCVVDADALNWLAAHPGTRLHHACITPHPGEAARLLAGAGYTDAAAIQADRLGAARLLARLGAIAVLKGAATLVAVDGEVTSVCDRGNPGMATAGAGDVLTGVIAGLAAQQPDRSRAPQSVLAQAARAGVLIHALAGDRAALGGERGVIASDLIGELRALVNPADLP